MHYPTDRITHTTAFVTPVVEHWLEREIAQWVLPMKDRSDDPSHHERTLLPRSYISLLSRRGVPNTISVSRSVISRLWNRNQQTQNVDDRPRSGRPRDNDRRTDRFIRNQALRNRSQTANQIVANLPSGYWCPSYGSDDYKSSSCSTAPGCTYKDKSSHCP